MTSKLTPKVRCAIYTRKSSEEGLDMEFNSLDAQRESCEAYIASQKPEGWLLTPDYYDDGGFSGGTLDRPALKRLIEDIERGLIDCVVVYKIDRLSRSLVDFTKLIEVFDRHDVKGTPASTIHSLIYRVSEATPEEVARIEAEAAKLSSSILTMPASERTFASERLKRLELRLADIHKPQFVLNEQSLVRDADLIVLDEVSMVGEEMASDLLAFGKPVLVLGDPGQLPPIKGAGAFTDVEPDVMLTEVHRQAGDSAIIRLATLARQGLPIPLGQHDDHVWKMSRRDVSPEQMLMGGQVICGMNATRRQLNNAMRQAAGFANTYTPTH